MFFDSSFHHHKHRQSSHVVALHGHCNMVGATVSHVSHVSPCHLCPLLTRHRGTETDEQVHARLASAEAEMELAESLDIWDLTLVKEWI